METLHKSDTGLVETFDSVAEYAARVRAVAHTGSFTVRRYPGLMPLEDALRIAETGTAPPVPAVERALAALDVSGILAPQALSWQSDVCGAVPLVPNLLADLPDSMLAMRVSERRDATAPLRLYVSNSVHGEMTDTHVTNRGVAALALAIALSNIRPVELYSVRTSAPNRTDLSSSEPISTHRIIAAVRIDLCDVPMAAFALTHPAFARRIGFAYLDQVNNDVSALGLVPFAYGVEPAGRHAAPVEALIRSDLHMGPDDIYIRAGHMSDGDLITNPVAWVQQQLDRYRLTA